MRRCEGGSEGGRSSFELSAMGVLEKVGRGCEEGCLVCERNGTVERRGDLVLDASG